MQTKYSFLTDEELLAYEGQVDNELVDELFIRLRKHVDAAPPVKPVKTKYKEAA